MVTQYKAIADIVVGERTRKDVGDLSALKASLTERGMLQPVGIDAGGKLVFGFRRLKAAEKLGWVKVPVVLVDKLADAAAYLKAERDENVCRKPFTKSELGQMAVRLLALEKPAAKERQKEHGGTAPGRAKARACGEQSGNRSQSVLVRARDVVGEALGVSGKTAEQAAEVVGAVTADPERNGDLPALMEAEGVKSAHRELTRRRAAGDRPRDALGIPVSDPVRPAFDSLPLFAEAKSLFRKLAAVLNDLAQSPGGAHLARKLAYRESAGKGRYEARALKDLAADVADSAPHSAVCPYCHNNHPGKVASDCRACLGLGWAPAVQFLKSSALPASYRAAVEALAAEGGAA